MFFATLAYVRRPQSPDRIAEYRDRLSVFKDDVFNLIDKRLRDVSHVLKYGSRIIKELFIGPRVAKSFRMDRGWDGNKRNTFLNLQNFGA